MKKISAILSAALVSSALCVPFSSSAEEVPSMWFVPRSESYSDGVLSLSRSDIENGLTVTVDIFIEDESATCWSVDPKWKSSSPYIVLDNVTDPQKPFIPYAYAEEKNGELTNIRHVTSCGGDEELNTMFFCCDIGFSVNRSPLTPYGEKTSDYALTSFDIVISEDTPSGDYDIYFLTEPEDYEDQRVTSVALRLEGNDSKVVAPTVSNFVVRIADEQTNLLGDINGDGRRDATDASEILSIYAENATGAGEPLSDEKKAIADVDGSGTVDAMDASCVLSYYAYVSTSSDSVTLEEFLKNFE